MQLPEDRDDWRRRFDPAGAPPLPGVWRPWRYGTTTQGKTFIRCPARWAWPVIFGLPEPETLAKDRGNVVHQQLENWLIHGTIPTGDYAPLALAIIPRLPAPPIDPRLVERRFDDFTSYAIHFRSIIDLIEPQHVQLPDGRAAIRVTDHKTTSKIDDWAKEAATFPTDFQICSYVAHVAQITGWQGPIIFRLLYAQTRGPTISAERAYTFEPAEVADARAFVGEVLAEMIQVAKMRDPAMIPHNLEACEDYKSRAHPTGCPYRTNCAQLGRETQGELSILFRADFNTTDLGDLIMTDPNDPLAALAAAPQAPAAADPLGALLQHSATAAAATPQAPAAADPLGALLQPPAAAAAAVAAMAEDPRPPMLARLAKLQPGGPVPLNASAEDLRVLLAATSARHSDLIGQVVALDPLQGSADGRALLQQLTIPDLEARITSLSVTPPAVDAMDRNALVAEILQRLPDRVTSADQLIVYTDVQLRGVLQTTRAQQATAAHAINSPENVSPTGPPPAPTPKAEKSTAKAKSGGDPTRGARMPDDYGGELVGRTTAGSGHLARFLTDHGYPVPDGKGATKDQRQLCAEIIAGVAEPPPTAAAPPAPAAPKPPAQPAPVSAAPPVLDPRQPALADELDQTVARLQAAGVDCSSFAPPLGGGMAMTLPDLATALTRARIAAARQDRPFQPATTPAAGTVAELAQAVQPAATSAPIRFVVCVDDPTAPGFQIHLGGLADTLGIPSASLPQLLTLQKAGA